MSKISEYLEAGRADKIYDPNKGLYVNPQSGEAFVPTFTNDPNSDIAQRTQGAMQRQGQPLDMSQGAYLIKDKQPTGMPGRGQPAQGEQPKVDPEDPWAVANYYMSSDKFKNEIFQKMFPGRDPSQGFQNEKERAAYFKALQSTRNMLVDNVKWKLEYNRKKKADQQKNATRGVSQQQLMKMIQEEKLRLDEVNNQATTMPENKIQNTMEQAKKNVMELLQATGGLMGQGEGGMPVDKGQRVQGPGTPQMPEPGKTPAQNFNEKDVQKRANYLGVQGIQEQSGGKTFGELGDREKYYASKNIMTALKKSNPDKSVDWITQAGIRIANDPNVRLNPIFTYEPKAFSERYKEYVQGQLNQLGSDIENQTGYKLDELREMN